MLDLEACKNADGTFDHKKYDELRRKENEERKAKGELCQLPGCMRFIVWSKGYPQTCGACKSLDNPKELHHDGSVRCPKCGNSWDVFGSDDYDLYSEGEHQVTCGRCDHEFEVVTSISYSFQSPERIKEGDTAQDDSQEGRKP